MEDREYMRLQWTQLVNRFTKEEQASVLWAEIDNAYGHSSRHYHSHRHIATMLKLTETYEADIEDIDNMRFSIFYHDIVYNSLRKDNEVKSGELAQKRLSEIGYKKDLIDKCYDQIIATQYHAVTADNDLKYLLDFDLSILGSDQDTYQIYSQNVRKEYAWVPGIMYRRGRRKVLKHFLDMPYIFKTSAFREQFEEQAKVNLAKELKSL